MSNPPPPPLSLSCPHLKPLIVKSLVVRLFAPVFRLRWVVFVCTVTDIYTPPDNRLQRQQIEIHLMYEE